MQSLSLRFPGKAGTHASAKLNLSSNDETLTIFHGLCPRHQTRLSPGKRDPRNTFTGSEI